MAKQTLHLILKKKWFDMIKSGEKKEEYRDITVHYLRRFVEINAPEESKGENKNIPDNILFDLEKGIYQFDYILKSYYSVLKTFDTVTFTNGYQPNSPRFEIEFKGIEIGIGLEKWGAETGKNYFVIKLGEVVSGN